MSYRISVDTGGTFTDIVVSEDSGRLELGKALTTRARAYEGLREGIGHALIPRPSISIAQTKLHAQQAAGDHLSIRQKQVDVTDSSGAQQFT